MHPWFKGCITTRAGKTIPPIHTISGAGIKGDFSGLVSQWHDVLMVHHETCCSVAAEMNLKEQEITFIFCHSDKCCLKKTMYSNTCLNKQLIKCRAEEAMEMGILNGMKEL